MRRNDLSMRLLIADDHALLRRSLRALLEARGFVVLGEAKDGAEAVELARRLKPDVVLMDLGLPGLDGIAATRAILADRPETRVVVITGFLEEEHLVEALEAGAHGYLLKSEEPELLFAALEAVVAGEPALPPAMAQKALARLARARSTGGGAPGRASSQLTEREAEVLRLMASGVSATPSLARRLGCAERTVKFHVGNVLDKLGVHSRAEAVAYALGKRLVEPPDTADDPFGDR
jgi:DNA-binding NarL/FixJ family response regulator